MSRSPSRDESACSAAPAFASCFQALTGHPPLRWQSRLFDRFAAGCPPAACDLPTGLGKTSVISVWLIALATAPAESLVPRRLLYVVNRRTVVDQATVVVEQMRARLRDPADPRWSPHSETLTLLARRLRALSADPLHGDPLAVSTLRGELADNQEWKADPARPAVVVGTVDMIGSKLLFSGYGDGRYLRAHHAGLTGQDVLIVHDEAHLTPAFGDLLHHVAQVCGRFPGLRPFRVLELSATQRAAEGGDILGLTPEDEADSLVRTRLDARKSLTLHPADPTAVVSKLVELASRHEPTRSKVLIYVRSPERAQDVTARLAQRVGADARARVATLTGTVRGHERDLLVKTSPVYQALLGAAPAPERTVYLVSTSAGEVGIDLDADHLVCEITTLDGMVQRLGRVNRRGGKPHPARVDVVVPTDGKRPGSEGDRAVQAAQAILERWLADSRGVLDVSPRHLGRLLAGLPADERSAAFAPKPQVPPLTDVLLDAWSLTAADRMPGRPEVASYLHGLAADPPETYVAWRKEVAVLHDAGLAEPALRDWFQACPLQAREQLRDRSDRVRKVLARLIQGLAKEHPGADLPVVVLDERGDAVWATLGQVVDKGFDLDYRTLVLPVEAGGLDAHGMLDAGSAGPRPGLDVAEDGPGENSRQRWLHVRTADGQHCERLLTAQRADELPANLLEGARLPLAQQAEEPDGSAEVDLVLLSADGPAPAGDTALASQLLAHHTDLVAASAGRLADALGLPKAIGDALVTAACWHDHGKERAVWQRYARNDGGPPLAKSPRPLHPRALGGYRHELGSLLDAAACEQLQDTPELDLVLHLIAAHHGWARPHFELRAADNTCSGADNARAFAEAMRRFGRLQARFGRWGLAWLEALLRCADIAASRAGGSPSAAQEAGHAQ